MLNLFKKKPSEPEKKYKHLFSSDFYKKKNISLKEIVITKESLENKNKTNYDLISDVINFVNTTVGVF
jgi:hypothetical protein